MSQRLLNSANTKFEDNTTIPAYQVFNEHVPQQGKNYLQYSNTSSYDDDMYNSYLSADYNPSKIPTPIAINTPNYEQPQPQQQAPPRVFPNYNFYLCPLCNQTASSVCNCVKNRTAKCPLSHEWYLNNQNMKELGRGPGHSSNLNH